MRTLSLAAALLALSCRTDGGKGADSPGAGGTDSRDTAHQGSDGFCAIQDIFDAGCVVCHSASAQAGSLDLQTDAHRALVGVPSALYADRTLVITGDAAGSFLSVKLSGAQTAAEGDPMPPGGPLSDADIGAVAAWIDGGATPDCTADTGTDTAPRYHPDGWTDPTRHGMAAKYQQEDCVACHGADLGGGSSGQGCDTCHTAGWRTDCTFCHGGTDNATGAPPQGIDDRDSPLTFPPHTAHVTRGDHPAYDCVQCHTRPADATAPGHFIASDSTPGAAEVSHAGGISARGSYSAGTCSNLYCHGNGQGDNGTVRADATVSCGGCHATGSSSESAIEGMSGQHKKHIFDVSADCATCHASTVDAAGQIIDPLLHVDGSVQISLPAGIAWANDGCTGSCHGVNHNSRDWN